MSIFRQTFSFFSGVYIVHFNHFFPPPLSDESFFFPTTSDRAGRGGAPTGCAAGVQGGADPPPEKFSKFST